MPLATLDPKNDVVFKMLFTRERNSALLRRLLEAFLRPVVPIASVRVLNPELSKRDSLDRGAVVDVLVVLQDGQRVHVEMQLWFRPAFVRRGLYYWARAFSDQLARGDTFDALQPTTGIFILNFEQLATPAFHSTFQLLEETSHSLLTDALTLHFLELPKVPPHRPGVPGDDPVLNWAQFFAANTDDDRHLIAMTDPTIAEAEHALAELSADPIAREYAFRRELELADYAHRLQQQREEGKQLGLHEGKQLGLHEGRREQLLASIDALAGRCGVELGAARRGTLARLDLDPLQDVLTHLALHHSWPDEAD